MIFDSGGLFGQCASNIFILKDFQRDMSDDDAPMPMPMPAAKRRRAHKMDAAREKLLLDQLPSAEMYEKSYMHRDIVTHVGFSQSTQFLVTASADGHVKFWRKMITGIEFVKHYKAHLKEVVGLAISADGLRLATTSVDRSVKFFDVLGFDMVHMLSLDFIPGPSCCWAFPKGAVIPKIVLSEKDSHVLRVFHAEGARQESALLHVLDTIHTAPVTVLAYNVVTNVMISGDTKGMLEYWSPDTYESLLKAPRTSETVATAVDSTHVISFRFKMETDLFALAKHKTYATTLDISASGADFVVTATDALIRVFRFRTGTLLSIYIYIYCVNACKRMF